MEEPESVEQDLIYPPFRLVKGAGAGQKDRKRGRDRENKNSGNRGLNNKLSSVTD